MKRKIIKIAKSNGYAIDEYKTYRSDMGCQVYDIKFTKDGKSILFSDSYYPGERGAQDFMLNQIELKLK